MPTPPERMDSLLSAKYASGAAASTRDSPSSLGARRLKHIEDHVSSNPAQRLVPLYHATTSQQGSLLEAGLPGDGARGLVLDVGFKPDARQVQLIEGTPAKQLDSPRGHAASTMLCDRRV